MLLLLVVELDSHGVDERLSSQRRHGPWYDRDHDAMAACLELLSDPPPRARTDERAVDQHER